MKYRIWAASVALGCIGCVQMGYAASPGAEYGEFGAVASRSQLASVIGARILRRGGNAVDAAVAVGFALAVTHPSAGNLGGGGFMVIRLADGTIAANDHREKAPGGASRDMYQNEDGAIVPGLSTASHLAVGVPGTVDGLLSVLARYGTLSRKEVITPALEMARRGFLMPRDLANSLARLQARFAKYPGSAKKFSDKDGNPYQAGDLFRQPDLADALERILRDGRDGFYQGKTADLIVAEMQKGGGLINHEDLAGYESVWREPIVGTYRGHEIISMPPPSSGGVLLVQMLNMLEAFDLSAMGFGSADVIHHMIEAERRAYADRAEHMGDSDFYDVPVAMLTDKDYARQRFLDFDAATASLSSAIGAGAAPLPESPDTTHMSVIDKDGNAVAYTTTLNLSYGSKIVAEGTGILLNNEMDDFSSKEDTPNAYGLIGREANAIEPGKRMLSSMTPTLVTREGEILLATGSPGGSTIITTTMQVVVNVIDHGMTVSDAVGRPRFHHQWLPNRVVFEALGFSPDTLGILEARGHTNLINAPFGLGDANSVMRTGEGYYGMTDPRQAGGAIGVNHVEVR